ncbi:MAG TPA: hypothetical protein VL175_00280 [Pirellulales bacterium]|nr:hypothetical protein [Pirellulales bacterium]
MAVLKIFTNGERKLARKKTAVKAPRKSDVIREIMKEKPKASVKEIRAALDARGVKASDALISKLKYSRGRKTARKRGRRGRAPSANGHSQHGSKATAIRNMFHEMGVNARARDIVAALAGQGITVSAAQVSTLRKSAPRRGRPSGRGVADSVSLSQLIAAKHLAEQLGGIEAAQRALETLAKLTG